MTGGGRRDVSGCDELIEDEIWGGGNEIRKMVRAGEGGNGDLVRDLGKGFGT